MRKVPQLILESKKTVFNIKSIKPHETVVILGRQRTGKSFFTARLLLHLSKTTPIILIDTKDEYQFVKNLDLEKLFKLRKGFYRINQIEVDNVLIDDLASITEFICENVFDKLKCIIAIEEAGNVITKNCVLYQTQPQFAKVLLQGGGKNIGKVIVSQRPAQLHTDIINEAQHIICFDLSGKHDIEAVKNWFEPEWFNELNIAGNHEFFHYDITNKKIQHCYRIYADKETIEYYTKIFGKS